LAGVLDAGAALSSPAHAETEEALSLLARSEEVVCWLNETWAAAAGVSWPDGALPSPANSGRQPMKQTSGSHALFFSKPLICIVTRRRVDMIPTFNSPQAISTDEQTPSVSPRGAASAHRLREK
jgi:hypothetical protein